jgi:hypothetical protein
MRELGALGKTRIVDGVYQSQKLAARKKRTASCSDASSGTASHSRCPTSAVTTRQLYGFLGPTDLLFLEMAEFMKKTA